jgi:hypothetical protein
MFFAHDTIAHDFPYILRNINNHPHLCTRAHSIYIFHVGHVTSEEEVMLEQWWYIFN